MRITILPLLALLPLSPVAMGKEDSRSESKALQIYFIDVEGGQSTLIVTPSGRSLLVDAGYAGTGAAGAVPADPRQARDAQRILAATRDAGLKSIDALLVTHFHPDHVGGVYELAALIPIRSFIDHGTVSPDADQHVAGTMTVFNAYMKVSGAGRHILPRPGVRLPLRGVDAVVVSAAAKTIEKPLSGGGSPNPACGAAVPDPRDSENPGSTGFRLQFGRFRFLDLGDLSGAPLHGLFCPRDLPGAADVYLLPHHGAADVSDPAMLGAIPPRVAVLNNGRMKGGAAQMFATLHGAPGIEDVWQLHRSENADARNFADERIANLDEGTAHWIKVNAWRDGSFVVTNARTGARREYPARSAGGASLKPHR